MQGSIIWKVYSLREIAKTSTTRIGLVCLHNYNTSVEKVDKEVGNDKRGSPKQGKNKEIAINIPRRIERSDTDILKALASTIKRDHTAPHYRYHDDPYLTPASNISKRTFALAKESGKKAAKWILQEHADLFNHRVADPPIEAYFPKPSYTSESNVSPLDLQTCIDNMQLLEAVKVYDLLKEKKIEVDRSLKQSLLEFVCYYNETEPLDEDWIEERWYKSGMQARERLKNSWKEQGVAEQLFIDLEPQTVAEYCALIRGRGKYYQADKSWQLYKEAESKGYLIDVETFNSLLRLVNFLRESSDLRWQLIQEILSDMERTGIVPNVGTLNSVLETLSTYGNIRQAKVLSLQVLSEFKKLGIEPSLGSYYNLIITHCKERGPVSSILVDILNELEGKAFEIRDPKDTFFFVTAMDICRNHLQNLDLAVRVDTLLHFGNNYDLIGDSFKESIYYRHFVAMKCNYETFDTFMEFYNKIVPNIYTPEPGIMEEIVSVLHLNGAVNYLPQLWSDMVIFDHIHRENLLALTLQAMSANYPEPEDSSFPHMSKAFNDISWKIWGIIELWDEDKPRKVNWNGKMLGDLLTIQVYGKESARAGEVMKRLTRDSHDVIGIPSLESLQLFLNSTIEHQNTAMSLLCVKYLSDAGFPEVVDLAQELYTKVKMDSAQIAKLNNMVGFDVTKSRRNSQTENPETQEVVS